jgi:hypothetical protein
MTSKDKLVLKMYFKSLGIYLGDTARQVQDAGTVLLQQQHDPRREQGAPSRQQRSPEARIAGQEQ